MMLRRRLMSLAGMEEEEEMKSIILTTDSNAITVDSGKPDAKSIIIFRKDNVISCIESAMILDGAPYFASIYNTTASNGLYGTKETNGTFSVADGVFSIEVSGRQFRAGEYFYFAW